MSTSNSKGFSLSQWSECDPVAFDRSEVFHAEIAPLIDRLHQLCQQHNLPAFAMVCFKQEANGDNRCRSMQHVPELNKLPAEVLMHLGHGGEAMGPETVGRVIGVFEADRIRIERFYNGAETTH